MADKDLYEILGVAKTATDDEIRKAYRKQARKLHPDVNPGNKEAEEKFKEVSAANDVLSEPAKRKIYDEFGHAGLSGGFDPEKARAYQRWQASGGGGARAPGRGGGLDVDDDADMFNLEDLLSQFRGSGGFSGFGGAGGGRPQTAAGRDMTATVELDFVDALKGTEVSAQIPIRRTCPTCSGSGDQPGTEPTTCPECSGSGRKQVARGPMKMTVACPRCGGYGKLHTPCTTCAGAGEVETVETIRVRIPPGADNGSELRVRGKGAPGAGGAPPGDLLIVTRIRPHRFFRREGHDLYLELPITLDEAYLGASIDVPTPDGAVQMKVPPRSQAGSKLRLRGRGVPHGAERGDLYVELDVRIPDKDDPAIGEALRAARDGYSRPVREGIAL